MRYMLKKSLNQSTSSNRSIIVETVGGSELVLWW